MRIERIEETTEANRVAAESVARGRARPSTEAATDTRVAELLPALARLIAGSPATAGAPSRTTRLVQASRLLGTTLGADHVGIYLSESPAEPAADPSTRREVTRFVLAARYSRRGLGASAALDGTDTIELSPGEEVDRRLRAGHSTRVFRPLTLRRAFGSSLPVAAGWSRIHATLRIPCPGENGPIALITLDGPFLDTRAARPLIEQAEAAASLVGSFLERDRLARELDSLRKSTRAETARSERLAALGRVASSAAHDFNNVLTAIVGYADLLELELPGGALAGRGVPELDEIRVAAARGATLVEELLAFGRTRPGAEQKIDLALALGRLDGMLRRVAGDEIELRARVAPGLPPVRLDLERFERIVVNLVANARHAIEARPGRPGRIELALDRVLERAGDGADAEVGESVRLRVSDDGCGMDAIVKRRLFEPFFSTRSDEGGTGLGLADVVDFANQAGARVEVESAPGAGCVFELRFPKASERARPAPAFAPARSAPIPSPASLPTPV